MLAAGCARTSGAEHAPAACVGGDAGARVTALRSALAKAPRPVALPDGTRISDCLAHDADSGDIQEVGSTLLTVTEHLADAARARPDRATLTQLGYLMGAVRRGAARAQGVDAEIVRRLDQELQGVSVGAGSFRAAERAGRATG